MKFRRSECFAPKRPYRRFGHFYRWAVPRPRRAAPALIAHPRRVLTWLVTTVVGSLWLLAASASHLGGAIFQRATTAVMQPLTADQRLAALQATAVSSIFGASLSVVLLVTARRGLKESRLRDAVPHTEKRDRVFSSLVQWARKFPRARKTVVCLIEMEKRNRWVLTLLPFLFGFVAGNLLTQYYVTRLPFSAGNAITTLGPIALAMAIAWREDSRGLALFLPLMSAVGAVMMVPWGQHIDGLGMVAALCAAVSSAVVVSAGKEIAHAGISLKGTTLGMVVGLLIGAPSLLLVHWTWEIVVRGFIAGLLGVAGGVLYWLAQAPLRLPKRMAGALSANGPALSCLVGLILLGQSVGLTSMIGISVILVASLLNAALTGSKDEKAAEIARYAH